LPGEGSGGPHNGFTHRDTTFMTWNLLHTARWLEGAGGFPVHGNQRSLWDADRRLDAPNPKQGNQRSWWDAGCRFDAPNPEHRV
jgi:hypothetical protein